MIVETKKFINANDLIPAKTPIVFAAVSGGIDSCVMLDILNHLKKDFGFKIEVLHFNHNTRGQDNIEDEIFVERLAQKYDIPFKFKRIENQTGQQSEVYLRDQRYKFFNSVLISVKNSLVATAHNSDDNVETHLMRLFKGSHLKGLTGIKPKRGFFIRPLLSQNRKTIEDYAKNNNISFREDHTNFNNQITRNFIRNELIPLINKNMKTNVSEFILKSITDLNQYYLLYTDILNQSIKESVKNIKHGVGLNKTKYKNYNSIIKKGLIEYCISKVQPLNYGISLKNFYLWDEFIQNSKPGKKRNILDTGYAVSERKEILFGDIPLEKNESYSLKIDSEIIIENKYRISFQQVEKKNVNFDVNKNVEFIDGDKSGQNQTVRFWQDGDSFRPLGMNQKRKLSDFFIDLKLSTRLKKETPILCKQDKIIWIVGYRLDDQFKISDNTKKIYRIAMTEVKNNA